MPLRDQNTLSKLYTTSILNEMNLGVNADTSSGGLGSPIRTELHSPEDYHVPMKYCAKCGKFIDSEDEETTSDSSKVTKEEYHDLQFAIVNLKSMMENQPYNGQEWSKERNRVASLESIYQKLAKLGVVQA